MSELTGLLRLAARVLVAVADGLDVLTAVVPNHVPDAWIDANAEWLWNR